MHEEGFMPHLSVNQLGMDLILSAELLVWPGAKQRFACVAGQQSAALQHLLGLHVCILLLKEPAVQDADLHPHTLDINMVQRLSAPGDRAHRSLFAGLD